MNAEAAEDTLSQLRRLANPSPRISLTELSRSTKWREQMAEYAIIELCDRSETAGYIVSPDGMRDILDRLESLEQELEMAQLEAIVAQRGSNTQWESGDELAAQASAALKATAAPMGSEHAS